VNPHGVIADKLHVGDGNVGGYGSGVEDSHAGVLIDARRAVTVAAQIVKRVVARVFWVPSNAQESLVAEGF
jgi:hypothetical protein